MSPYAILAIPASLVGVAAVLAVVRANKDDLPDIVRALMRMGPRDDDSTKTPPSFPKPSDSDEPSPPSLPKP